MTDNVVSIMGFRWLMLNSTLPVWGSAIQLSYDRQDLVLPVLDKFTSVIHLRRSEEVDTSNKSVRLQATSSHRAVLCNLVVSSSRLNVRVTKEQ